MSGCCMKFKHILEAASIIRDKCDSDESLQQKIKSRAAITIAVYKQVSTDHVYENKNPGEFISSDKLSSHYKYLADH